MSTLVAENPASFAPQSISAEISSDSSCDQRPLQQKKPRKPRKLKENKIQHICKCCNKLWKTKTMMTRHLESKHITGEPRKEPEIVDKTKTYTCNLCLATWSNPLSLSRHTMCKKRLDQLKADNDALFDYIKTDWESVCADIESTCKKRLAPEAKSEQVLGILRKHFDKFTKEQLTQLVRQLRIEKEERKKSRVQTQ